MAMIKILCNIKGGAHVCHTTTSRGPDGMLKSQQVGTPVRLEEGENTIDEASVADWLAANPWATREDSPDTRRKLIQVVTS